MRHRVTILWLIVLLNWFYCCYDTVAQSSTRAQFDNLLVAAHFYVISYAVWPPSGELHICIADTNRLKDALKATLNNRKTSGHQLIAVDLAQNEEIKIIETCNAVILGDQPEWNKTIIDHFRGRPILTLSSETDITTQGGMVFLPQGKPPRILLRQVKDSGLKIDATLLAISEIIQ